MTTEITKSNVAEIAKVANSYSAQDDMDLISAFGSKNRQEDMNKTVRLVAIAPVMVRDFEAANEIGKRSKGDQADLLGCSATDFSQQQFLVTVARRSAGGYDIDGGTVVGSSAGGKVTVDEALDYLTKYRAEVRKPADVIVPLADALAEVAKPGPGYVDAVRELLESFGHLAAIYNIGRGLAPNGKVVRDEDEDESGDDQQTPPSQSWQEMVAEAARRACEAGAPMTDVVKLVRDIYENQ